MKVLRNSNFKVWPHPNGHILTKISVSADQIKNSRMINRCTEFLIEIYHIDIYTYTTDTTLIFLSLCIDGSVSTVASLPPHPHRVTPATCSAHSRVWAQARAVRMPIITHLTSRRGEYFVIKREIFDTTVSPAPISLQS